MTLWNSIDVFDIGLSETIYSNKTRNNKHAFLFLKLLFAKNINNTNVNINIRYFYFRIKFGFVICFLFENRFFVFFLDFLS